MIYLAFIFGLVFGSFMNAIIYRLKNGLPISGRSFCPECKAKLKWYDLIPLLNFIWLRRRCRYCHKRISWQYPAVEFMSGILWFVIFYKNKFDFLNAGYEILIFSALLVIAVYDARWKIIPDKVVYPAIAVALTYNIFNAIAFPLFTALSAFLFFFAIYYFSKGKAMGLGDAKLAFLIGLFLGPWPALTAFISAFIIGAAFGIILIWLGRKNLKSQIAFGPFLVLGAFLAFFFSDFIIKLLNF